MQKFIFASLLITSLSSINAQNKTVKSCEQRCSLRPALITIEKESSYYDIQLKKMKDYNFCIQSCLGENSNLKPVPYEKFLKLKDETKNCETQLPAIFKKSFEEKYLSEIYKTTTTTKDHLTKFEDDNNLMDNWEKKKRVCQDHLDGKFDQAIYQEYFSKLKSCQEDLKSLKLPKNSYKSLEDIAQFVKNRAEKRILIPNKGADAVIVARKVDECRNEYDQLKNLAKFEPINNTTRGSFKEKQETSAPKTLKRASEER